MPFTCKIYFFQYFSILSSLLFFFGQSWGGSRKKGRGEEGGKGKGNGAREKLEKKEMEGRGGRREKGF